MSPVKLFVDNNYPKRLFTALEQLQGLQEERRYEVVRWQGQRIAQAELINGVVLLVDHGKSRLEVPVLRHYEDGYRVVVCRMGIAPQTSLFNFAFTVLRLWPQILHKAADENRPFLYTFTPGRARLDEHKASRILAPTIPVTISNPLTSITQVEL